MSVLGPLRGLGSALSLLAVLVWFGLGGLVLRLGILPAAWLWPGKRPALTSGYMKAMSRGILLLLGLGGARFRWSGALPTDAPALIVMNHQSLVDILIVTLMARPYVPAFVPRARYARFIPLVSPCIRLLGCPIVDPRRDPRGALAAMEEGARSLEHGLLIFPEGHRSLDGEIRRWRTAGAEAVLRARRMPVYLVVGDGLWTARRFVDFVFNAHTVRGEAEAFGPFAPPEAETEIPAFLTRMRELMVERLRQMRQRRTAAAHAA